MPIFSRSGLGHKCLVALIPAMLLVLWHPDLAQAKCNPGRADNYETDYMAGWIRSDPHLQTISTEILNYSPWVNVDPNTGFHTPVVLASAMLQGPALAGGEQYAQAGWMEYPYGYRYTFDEWGDPGATYGYHRDFFPAKPVGQYDYYSVDAPGHGNFNFAVDGTIFNSVPQLFAQNLGVIFGEIHTAASQMPSDDFVNAFVNTGGYIDFFNGSAFSSLAPPFWSVVYSPTEAQISDAACP